MGLYSIRPIISAHYQTVISESNSKLKVWGVFIFLPIVFAVISGVVFNVSITSGVVVTIISILAILIGFSINAVFLLIDHAKDDPSELEQELLENTRNITLYAIIFGIFTLSFAGLVLLSINNDTLFSDGVLLLVVSSVLYASLAHYILTLLLLPARLYVIVETSS